MLRYIQFKVATEINLAGQAVKVAEGWEKELEAFDDKYAYPGAKLSMEFFYLGAMISTLDVAFPLGKVVNIMVRVLNLVDTYIAFISNHPMLRGQQIPDFKAFANIDTCLQFAIAKCKTADDVKDFLLSLVELENNVARQAWDQFRGKEILAGLLIDNTWLNEINVSTPDWDRCFEVLDLATRIGLSVKVDSIVAYAYRAKSIVEKEYLQNTIRALEVISEGEEKLGYSHQLLNDYRAKILYLDEQWEDALKIWEPLLNDNARRPKPDYSLSYREAEICASNLGRWEIAADLALKGEAVAGKSYPSPIKAVEFRADYALTCWRAGLKKVSISAFAQVLNGLSDLPSPQTDLRSHSLHLKVGYVIAWLWETVKGAETRPQPDPAFFTNPSINEEIRNYPTRPRVYSWQFLADVEYALNAGENIFKRLNEEKSKENMPHIAPLFGRLKLKHDLRNLAFDNLVQDFQDFSSNLNISTDSESIEEDGLDNKDLSNALKTATSHSAIIDQLI